MGKQRRVDLGKALAFKETRRGFEEPGLQPAFLQEIFPVLDREAAFAEMHARWARDKAQEAREHDELAKQGESFVAWPSCRRWPQQPSAWSRHAAWFAMWRAKAKQETRSKSTLKKAANQKTLSKA